MNALFGSIRRLPVLLSILLFVLGSARSGATDVPIPASAMQMQDALHRKGEKSKLDFVENNQNVWTKLQGICGSDEISNRCADAALYAASAECEDASRYFRKSNRGWQVLSIALTLSSAAFTGVGASTISQAKVFSTLGGSTGLAAILPTLNAAQTGDQAGMVAVAAALGRLQAFALPTGSTAHVPDNRTIFQQARLFGASCAAAANASPSDKPSGPSSSSSGKDDKKEKGAK